MIQPQVLRGMRDFLPAEMLLRQKVIGLFREIFERHGFEPIETPVLEYYEALTGNLDDERLIYHFEDHGGREVGLRFDLTVPLARYVALHQNDLTFPFKRYHIAPVWRADRPQRGRYREFWQCDADIVGSRSMLADADVVSIFVEALDAVRMPNFAVHINHRKLLEAIAEHSGVDRDAAGGVYRSIDKLDKIGSDGVVDELETHGVDRDVASRVVDLIAAEGSTSELLGRFRKEFSGNDLASESLNELDDLFSFLAASGVEEQHVRFDPSLARGMSYYTGPVYEARVTEPAIGSLGGAGRYDGLVSRFSRLELPATGISLGLERIIYVVQELGLLDVNTTVSEVLVTVFDADRAIDSLAIGAELRRAGIRTEVYLEPGRNLGRQFRYADDKGIRVAIVAGPDELERDSVAIKNLVSGDQQEVARNDLVEKTRELLSTTAATPA